MPESQICHFRLTRHCESLFSFFTMYKKFRSVWLRRGTVTFWRPWNVFDVHKKIFTVRHLRVLCIENFAKKKIYTRTIISKRIFCFSHCMSPGKNEICASRIEYFIKGKISRYYLGSFEFYLALVECKFFAADVLSRPKTLYFKWIISHSPTCWHTTCHNLVQCFARVLCLFRDKCALAA